MKPKETRYTPFALQLRNVDVEVHPIDALDLQDHIKVTMPSRDLSDALWYAHSGSGSTPIHKGSIAAYIIGKNCLQFFTVDRSLSFHYVPRPGLTTYISSV